jgi:hypothetical protein
MSKKEYYLNDDHDIVPKNQATWLVRVELDKNDMVTEETWLKIEATA